MVSGKHRQTYYAVRDRNTVMGDIVVAGSSVPGLAREISEDFRCKFAAARVHKFPDGELHIQVTENVYGKRVIYIQSMSPCPDDKLVELLITVDLLNELGADNVTLVAPYLGYTRQDARMKPGEAVNARTLFKLLDAVRINELVSVDIHLHRLSSKELAKLTDITIKEVSAIPQLAQHVGNMLDNPLMIAPDSEAGRFAKVAAKVLGSDYDVMQKRRLSPTKVQILPKKLHVEGGDVVIVDDIVSTGDTMVETAKALKQQGARRIIAAFTHPVLSDESVAQKMFDAGISKIISTNTIPSKYGVVSVADLIVAQLE
ncbi:MAG: ribose-phosphate diphosphokinase [Methanocellales archaeon]|nr:ribose-phosphate diphosphokinase [Methanocellales archaeon]